MVRIVAAGVLALITCAAAAQDEAKRGADLYARHCAACHGVRMRDPEGAYDLLKFPHDAQERFVNAVTRGKSSMAPFGGLLTAEEISALWAYVVSGGK